MKRFTAIILFLSIILTVFGVSVSADGSDNVSTEKKDFSKFFTSSYKNVAKSKNLTMIADNNGSFVIKNNKTGYCWYSHPKDIEDDKKTVGINKRNNQSELVVFYVYKDDKSESSSYALASVNSQSLIDYKYIKTEVIKNGILVTYDFYNISARITVSYTIENDVFVAKVIGKKTLEGKEFRNAVKDTLTEEQKNIMQESYITSIWLLPTFAAGNPAQKGFVFVPDGCGAYMNYTSASHATEISNIPVYGDELSIDEYGVKRDKSNAITREKKAYIPAFAIANGNNGIAAFINKGAENASINAFKAGSNNFYTGVSAQIDLRKITYATIGYRTVQGIAKSFDKLPDFEIDYYFLHNKNLSIATFANFLRNKWSSQGYLKKHETEPSLSLQIIGAIDVDSNFLGFPIKRIKALTTINQAISIVDKLKNEANADVSVNYVGWQGNGLQNSKVVKKAKPIRSLGKIKDLKSLSDVCSSLYLDTDLITFKKSGNGISVNSDGAKTAFDKPVIVRDFSFSKYVYLKSGYNLLSPSNIFIVYEKYKKSLDKLPDDIGISFNKLSASCYSDFGKNSFSRIQTVKEYNRVFSNEKRSMSAQSANFYSFKSAERIYNAPSASSRQKIYDGEVPFYQMILHGYAAVTSPYLNQSAMQEKAFLRAVETGCEPAYNLMYEDSGAVNGTAYDYLYGTTFSMHKSDIVNNYKKYANLLKKISDKAITDYIIHNDYVTETVYENGIRVFVNYGNKKFVLGKITVKPNSFYDTKEG